VTQVPEGLSQDAGRLWLVLHAGKEFSPDADELLRRSLNRFDLADELLGLAREVGLTTTAGRGALSGSRDAEMAGLKLMLAVGLSKADMEALGRPGRPPGGMLRGRVSVQPRDPLSGRPLRKGLA
jgi:hypothetical protein